MIDRWECQVFAFVLDISEVNAFFILRYFVYGGLVGRECLRSGTICGKIKRWRIVLGRWRWGRKVTYSKQLIMLSKIYGG